MMKGSGCASVIFAISAFLGVPWLIFAISVYGGCFVGYACRGDIWGGKALGVIIYGMAGLPALIVSLISGAVLFSKSRDTES